MDNIEVLRSKIVEEFQGLDYLINEVGLFHAEWLNKYDNYNNMVIGDCKTITYLPESNQDTVEQILSGKFDYHRWRLLNKLPNVMHFINRCNGVVLVRGKETREKLNKKSFERLKKCLFQMPELQEIKSCIKIYYIDEYIDTSCVELSVSGESVIIISNKDSIEDQFLYLIHELGHAITNNFKYQYNYLFSTEADEFFAHLFEYAIFDFLLTKINKESMMV